MRNIPQNKILLVPQNTGMYLNNVKVQCLASTHYEIDVTLCLPRGVHLSLKPKIVRSLHALKTPYIQVIFCEMK